MQTMGVCLTTAANGNDYSYTDRLHVISLSCAWGYKGSMLARYSAIPETTLSIRETLTFPNQSPLPQELNAKIMPESATEIPDSVDDFTSMKKKPNLEFLLRMKTPTMHSRISRDRRR